MKNNLPEGVTPEMIKAWKEQYGPDKVKLATLAPEVPEKTKDVVVRVPDRQTYNQYDKWVGTDPGKAKDILINACLLSNKEEVKADDVLYFSCYWALSELLPLHKAIVGDL
ncbi:hypothetical protein [Dysgonomonas termitidis]|uniref:Uncharacterized protein n=1 Tax=Dysgonomonas termitidis TaxID=1516126 RepID=A0ABV9KUB9_9BACT